MNDQVISKYKVAADIANVALEGVLAQVCMPPPHTPHPPLLSPNYCTGKILRVRLIVL